MVPREMIILEEYEEDSSEQSDVSQYNTPVDEGVDKPSIWKNTHLHLFSVFDKNHELTH